MYKQGQKKKHSYKQGQKHLASTRKKKNTLRQSSGKTAIVLSILHVLHIRVYFQNKQHFNLDNQSYGAMTSTPAQLDEG
jgi:hypothetical protein